MKARATVYRADGSIEELETDVPKGFLPSEASDLQKYRGGGWQQSDPDHPTGGGRPGYRVAYKTHKVLPSKDVFLTIGDFRVSFVAGKLNRGGLKTPDGLPGRHPDEHIVPEYGMRLLNPDGTARYLGCPYPPLHFEAWEKDTGGLTYVEIICRFASDVDPAGESMRRAGRAVVATLKTTLDLVFGPRLLGIPLLEEIGEVFDDWHWNRRLDSVLLSNEIQLPAIVMGAEQFLAQLKGPIDKHRELTADLQRRLRLACQWYWLADAEPDATNRFVQLWVVVEALEMQTTDIAPVKARLAELLGTATGVGEFVGRLFGTRSSVVHGNAGSVTSDRLERMESMARLLLGSRLCDVSDWPEIELLRNWVGTP